MPVPAVHQTSVRATTLFQLEALEGLPCGCVTAVYRTRPSGFLVVAVEAQGPHCILAGHTSGQILRLGDPADLFAEEDGESAGR